MFFPSTEKHKTYHIKDEQLARDGFKKFLKNEPCSYERCRFSQQCNHIHCVREGCFYVLHSSGQLLSHKRKHERLDSEQAYQQFKLTHKGADAGSELSSTLAAPASSSSLAAAAALKSSLTSATLTSYLAAYRADAEPVPHEALLLQQIELQKQALLQNQRAMAEVKDEESSLLEAQKFYEAEKKRLQQLNAAILFAQNNFTGDQAEPLNLHLKPKEPMASLPIGIPSIPVASHRSATNLQQITSIEGLFNRKRGRPPKNRVVEVYQNVSNRRPTSGLGSDLSKAFFYRFKAGAVAELEPAGDLHQLQAGKERLRHFDRPFGRVRRVAGGFERPKGRSERRAQCGECRRRPRAEHEQRRRRQSEAAAQSVQLRGGQRESVGCARRRNLLSTQLRQREVSDCFRAQRQRPG